jgi:hypothetical protein
MAGMVVFPLTSKQASMIPGFNHIVAPPWVLSFFDVVFACSEEKSRLFTREFRSIGGIEEETIHEESCSETALRVLSRSGSDIVEQSFLGAEGFCRQRAGISLRLAQVGQ